MYNEKYDYVGGTHVMHFRASWCTRCSHFNGAQEGTCSAYPNGIPSRFADMVDGVQALKHDSVQQDQKGVDTLNFV